MGPEPGRNGPGDCPYNPLFLAIDVPEMLCTEHVESNLMKKLDEIVSS